MKDKLRKTIIIKIQLEPKTYTYLVDDGSEDKKAKVTKIVS